MNNYRNKYIKYKLKYLKLKQMGGSCFGRTCLSRKDNIEKQDNIIKAKAVIYLEDVRQDEYDLFINKNKHIMNSINIFLKNLKKEKYLNNDNLLSTIKYGDIELIDSEDLLYIHEDMENDAIINIYFNFRYVKCAACGKEDKITSNRYSDREKKYLHNSVNQCLDYVKAKYESLKQIYKKEAEEAIEEAESLEAKKKIQEEYNKTLQKVEENLGKEQSKIYKIREKFSNKK